MRVLNALRSDGLEIERSMPGGRCRLRRGRPTPLRGRRWNSQRKAEAVLFGAVGRPALPTRCRAPSAPEQGLLGCANRSDCSPKLRRPCLPANWRARPRSNRRFVSGSTLMILRELDRRYSISASGAGHARTENGERRLDTMRYRDPRSGAHRRVGASRPRSNARASCARWTRPSARTPASCGAR